MGRILLTIVIIAATVLVSSPFGGMLWHYYDMKAGYFPTNWLAILVGLGDAVVGSFVGSLLHSDDRILNFVILVL